MKKRVSRILATAGMTLALTAIACTMTTSNEADAAKKVKISLNKKKCNLTVGEKVTLKATVKPTKKKVVFKTNKKRVATVSKKGVVIAKKAGSAKITATVKGTKKKATCKIKVTNKVQTTAPAPSAPSQITQPQATVISVTSVTLDKTSVSMYAGTTEQLSATVLPENATWKNLTWSSSDSKIATVSNNGLITGIKKGTTQITAHNISSGKSAVCTVTVRDDIIVSTPDELTQALANDNIAVITIQTNDEASFTIPTSNHSGKQLVLNAPNATLTSGASLDEVLILGGSYTQTAGTTNCVVTADSTVTIQEEATSNITVNEPASQVRIVNDGSVPSVSVYSPAKVNIDGSATDLIALNASKPANIVTNQPVNASFTDKVTLSLLSGAENSVVSVDKAANKPDIRGLGYIEVSYKDGTATETVVPGQLATEDATKVNVTGFVKDAYSADTALSDVMIYLIPDSVELNLDTTAAAVENNENAIPTTTDETGTYIFENTPIGNYCLIAKKDGYTTAIQRFSVTSHTGDIFSNEILYLLDSSVPDNNNASVSGNVKNATNNETISGLTVQLFLHKGNTIGSPLATTITDSDGNYTFENLGAQQYTIQIAGTDDYISNKKSVCVSAAEESTANILVSPKLSGEGIRFVLTWGSKDSGAPADLDAHLIGPTANGGTFEVNYASRNFAFDDIAYAQLDVDNTDYEGPETITIHSVTDGIYTYYVHNFSGTPDFSFSGAQVNVYQGSELISTYNAPSETPNDYWKVCTYNSATGRFRGIGTYLSENEYYDEIGDYVMYGMTSSIESITQSNSSYIEYYCDYQTPSDHAPFAALYLFGYDGDTYESIRDDMQIHLTSSEATYQIIDKNSEEWNKKYADLDTYDDCLGMLEIHLSDTLTTHYQIYFCEY